MSTAHKKNGRMWTLTVEHHDERSVSLHVKMHGRRPKGQSTASLFRELCFDCIELVNHLEPIVDSDGELPS